MKKLSFTLVYSLLTIFVYAQQYSISGKVIDKENKSIEFATVILKKDGKVMGKSVTDILGKYQLSNIQAGHYTVLISYINFDKREIPIHVLKDTFLNIELVPLANHLQEVVISSKKPLIEKKADRIVFNVENSTTAIGADALELLSKIPSVKTNQKNGVELVGKGKVDVMIDDRLTQLSGDDLANMLKSISADDISKIEVITNPGAQYDAQGNNGFINILSKRGTKLGYNGSVRMGHSQATYPTFSSGGNFNYNKNKIKLHSNINVNDGSNALFLENMYFHPTQILEQRGSIREYERSINGQFSADYQIGKTTSLGITYDKNVHKPDQNEHNSSPTNNYTTVTHTNTDNRSDANTVNISLRQLLDTAEKKITIDGTWFTYQIDNQRTIASNDYLINGQLTPGSFSQFMSRGNNQVKTYTLKTDVELPFKIASFTTGSKLSFINNQNDVSRFQFLNNNYQLDPDQTNSFNYTENTQALYASMSKVINKWNIQAGLRGEFTQISTKSVSTGQMNVRHYFELFPTVSITYNQDDKHAFFINYGRRINRPTYDELNPFRTYISPGSYFTGNPFLQPSFNNHFELAHTYHKFLTTSLSFDYTNKGIREVTSLENGSNTQVIQFHNFDNKSNYELSNSVALHPFTWLESNTMFILWYMTIHSSSPQIPANIKGFGAYFNTNNSINLNQAKTISGDVNFWYIFPSQDGIYKLDATYGLDLGLKMALNQKIQIALNATDIFRSNKFTVNTFVNQVNEYSIYRPDNNSYKLSISYKFGNSKIKHDVIPMREENERAKKKSEMGL